MTSPHDKIYNTNTTTYLKLDDAFGRRIFLWENIFQVFRSRDFCFLSSAQYLKVLKKEKIRNHHDQQLQQDRVGSIFGSYDQ